MAPRILIVDDHRGFRTSARRVLSSGGFEVVGEAADARSALVAARDLRPDVVLLDVELPDGDGFEVAHALAGGRSAPAVVLTSSHDSADLGSLLARSPARGFVPKAELSARAVLALMS